MAQVDPGAPLAMAAHTLWRSVDGFGEEGSRKKELGIARAILAG
ncbi:MAG: hypothetical protein ACE5KY_07335 [Candidatus Tectimicrobiota bacterium]